MTGRHTNFVTPTACAGRVPRFDFPDRLAA
jgi:hypothetical protein